MTDEKLRETGRKIRLIVCDMDGTLLDSRREISPRNLQAIRSAREKGVPATLCSGRVHSMLAYYTRRLALDIPYIASNGAAIVEGDRILYQRLVPAEEAKRLLEFAGQHALDCCALGSAGGFFSSGGTRVERFREYNRMAQQADLPQIPLHFFDDGYANALASPIHKILLYRLSGEQTFLASEFVRQSGKSDYTFSEPLLMDISAAGVSKGNGVRKLAQLLGLEKDQICVFGDYKNDLPMFAEAGLAVAMGNAAEEVKAAADWVTTSNDEDGIAEAIDRFIL